MRVGILGVMILGASVTALGQLKAPVGEPSASFDHATHSGVFPSCVSCHLGAAVAGASLWPRPESCNACHDGVVEDEIDWTPRVEDRPTNLRFDHARHRNILAAERTEVTDCISCHAQLNAPWMDVTRSAVNRCLTCHEIETEHLLAPDTACAECHVPLVEAVQFTSTQVAQFPTPQTHDEPEFARAGHGVAATARTASGDVTVAASCATCHARDFCMTCHVDAPEQRPIQALGNDRRSIAISAKLVAPDPHGDRIFLRDHGTLEISTCVTCHTQNSCETCHVSTPEVAQTLHRGGPDRGMGAILERRMPPSHGLTFRDGHGVDAAASPATCSGCHAREDCLECHRPNPAVGSPGYHPEGFLTRHPSAAYARETTCSNCHNDRAFCADCHASAGLLSLRSRLGAGFHDAKPTFSLGHGQAARQSLESCVTCHVENDCLPCHSATGAGRFNPHGPGFDAARLRERNPEMCRVCHLN